MNDRQLLQFELKPNNSMLFFFFFFWQEKRYVEQSEGPLLERPESSKEKDEQKSDSKPTGSVVTKYLRCVVIYVSINTLNRLIGACSVTVIGVRLLPIERSWP